MFIIVVKSGLRLYDSSAKMSLNIAHFLLHNIYFQNSSLLSIRYWYVCIIKHFVNLQNNFDGDIFL